VNDWARELEAIDESLEVIAERVTQDEYVKGGSSASAILDTLKLMRSLLGDVTASVTGIMDAIRED
jgi:hypothetical protein